MRRCVLLAILSSFSAFACGEGTLSGTSTAPDAGDESAQEASNETDDSERGGATVGDRERESSGSTPQAGGSTISDMIGEPPTITSDNPKNAEADYDQDLSGLDKLTFSREKPGTELDHFTPMSAQQIEDFLSVNNAIRKAHQVPDMRWNERLQEMAQEFTNYCLMRSHPNYGSGSYLSKPGSNWQWWSAPDDSFDWKRFPKGNYGEIKNFSFQTMKSVGGEIGHFTQLVWKESIFVGCAQSICWNAAHSARETNRICLYYPPANFGGPTGHVFPPLYPPYEGAPSPAAL